MKTFTNDEYAQAWLRLKAHLDDVSLIRDPSEKVHTLQAMAHGIAIMRTLDQDSRLALIKLGQKGATLKSLTERELEAVAAFCKRAGHVLSGPEPTF